jgi:glycerol-3-phosphate acyltransferase PlsY
VEHHIYAILIGYFLGAIPFSFLIGKLKGIDIRKVGSGNVGGTNVLRSAGALYGALAFFLDILKGYLAVIFVSSFGINAMLLSGSFAVFGHCFPIYLKFKGGKGVATTFGVFLAINPWSGLVFFLIWLLIVIFTKYVSLGSIVGLLGASIFTFFIGKDYWVIFLALSLFSMLRHKENIKRLLNGNERKTDVVKYFFGKGKKD